MGNSLGLVMTVAAGWATTGVVLAVVMGRRGHSSFAWLVLGVLLGPLALILADDARRHDELLRRALVAPARASAGVTRCCSAPWPSARSGSRLNRAGCVLRHVPSRDDRRSPHSRPPLLQFTQATHRQRL